MEKPMMKCGHAANAVDRDDNPVCAICIGIDPGAETIAETPDLSGRKARCAYYRHCKSENASSVNLAFFEHKPKEEYDTYYCGCMGWD